MPYLIEPQRDYYETNPDERPEPDAEQMVACEEAEATEFAVYALHRDADGLTYREWLADFPTRTEAEAFVAVQ
jgi:hypothetical protein